MQRIRVMQLVSGLAIGAQSGGAERVGIEIACRLDRSEFDPVIYVVNKYEHPAEKFWLNQIEQEGIPVYGMQTPGESRIRHLGTTFRDLWHFVTSTRPDIINSHSERSDFLNALIHCFHPIHPKAVRTIHLTRQWITRPYLGEVLNNFVFPLIINKDTAVSESIAQKVDSFLLNRVLRRHATVCYNGIDEHFFLEQVPQKQAHKMPPGFPASGPYVGIIGRLTEQKGHSYLLQAMQIVCRQKAVQLLVIGSGHLLEELAQQTQILGIEEDVHFLGNRQDIIEILQSLDLVVSASIYEGFPTVLLEAMSQSVPVVTTDIPGTREIVENRKTGLLVPPADPAGLAEAILFFLTNPEKAAEMADHARQTASQFTIQNMARCHSYLYKSLTRKNT